MTRVVAVSPTYETDPVGAERFDVPGLGGSGQGRYLNAAAELSTGLLPEELLDGLQSIEAEAGRLPESQRRVWGPRPLDLDILLYGDLVVSDHRLSIPHPLLHERWFALRPLADLDPGVVHPLLQMTVGALLESVASPAGSGQES